MPSSTGSSQRPAMPCLKHTLEHPQQQCWCLLYNASLGLQHVFALVPMIPGTTGHLSCSGTLQTEVNGKISSVARTGSLPQSSWTGVRMRLIFPKLIDCKLSPGSVCPSPQEKPVLAHPAVCLNDLVATQSYSYQMRLQNLNLCCSCLLILCLSPCLALALTCPLDS